MEVKLNHSRQFTVLLPVAMLFFKSGHEFTFSSGYGRREALVWGGGGGQVSHKEKPISIGQGVGSL